MNKLRIRARGNRNSTVIEYFVNRVYIGYTQIINGNFYKSPGIEKFAKEHGL